MMPKRLDLFVFEQTILQDLFGAQCITSMDQSDFGGKVCQEQRLFDGSVSATNHDDFLPAVKEAVACRTSRYAEAFEFFFGWQSQPFGPRTCRKNNSVTCVDCTTVTLRGERALGQVEISDDIADDLSTHRFSMRLHPDHKVWSLHFGITGPVFDLGGCGQLAARFDPLNQDRVQHGAAGVNTGGVAGWPRSDDQQAGMTCLRHEISLFRFLMSICVLWAKEKAGSQRREAAPQV